QAAADEAATPETAQQEAPAAAPQPEAGPAAPPVEAAIIASLAKLIENTFDAESLEAGIEFVEMPRCLGAEEMTPELAREISMALHPSFGLLTGGAPVLAPA